MKVLASLVPGQISSPDLHMVTCLLYPHMTGRDRLCLTFDVPFFNDTNKDFTFMNLSKSNYLPKSLSANTTSLGVMVSTYEFLGQTFYL